MSICTLAEHMEDIMENDHPITMRFRIPVLAQRLHMSKWEMHPVMATLTVGMHWIMPDSFRCSIETEDYNKTSGNFYFSIDDLFAAEKNPDLIPSIEHMEFTAETKKQIINAIRQFINEGAK